MIALFVAGALCAAGFESDAKAVAAKMGKGWNLGNSLEACSSATQADETSWGNPKTTEALIKAVKAAGFKTIRVPCAWSGYIEDQKTY
jgi:endoglucanase